MEHWKPIVGFPMYVVSSMGKIKRVMDCRYKATGKCLNSKPSNNGYITVSLYEGKKHEHRSIHSIVCEAFHGPRPSKDHQATHKDGVKTNNKASNLRWATRKENMADKYVHGTMPLGDKHHSRIRPDRLARGEKNGGGGKLTASDVRKIRKDGRLHYVIAKDYGVVKSMISMIKRGEVWRHIL